MDCSVALGRLEEGFHVSWGGRSQKRFEGIDNKLSNSVGTTRSLIFFNDRLSFKKSDLKMLLYNLGRKLDAKSSYRLGN